MALYYTDAITTYSVLAYNDSFSLRPILLQGFAVRRRGLLLIYIIKGCIVLCNYKSILKKSVFRSFKNDV